MGDQVITLCSIMRNSSEYLGRYLAQVGELKELYPELRVVIGEGDHIDQTSSQLHLFSHNYCEILDVSHGGPRYPSIDHPERWDQIAGCVRAVLDKVGDPGRALIWVESDLIWEVPDLAHLLQELNRVPAVAPQVLINGSERFYDTWGYRNNGAGFLPDPLYWHEPAERKGDLVKIDSCGSCFVAGPEMYGALDTWSGHWPATVGGELWLDPRVTIFHP